MVHLIIVIGLLFLFERIAAFYYDKKLNEKLQKMPKFAQPVSMIVTKEQFKRDLKKPLKKLGYEISDFIYERSSNATVLVSSYAGVHIVDYVTPDFKSSGNRYYIDHYNSELFLGIAAMTTGEDAIKGELLYDPDINLVFRAERNYTKKELDRKGHQKATLKDIVNTLSHNPDKTYIINYLQAQEIIDMSCEAWATRLASLWAQDIVLKNTIITVDHDLLEAGIKDANDNQIEVLKRIFPDYFNAPVYEPKVGELVLYSEDNLYYHIGVYAGKDEEDTAFPYKIYNEFDKEGNLRKGTAFVEYFSFIKPFKPEQL